MQNTKKIKLLFWSVAIFSIPLWLLSDLETSFRHNKEFFYVFGSQLFAITGFAMLALSFVLSTRNKYLEKYFGGLDKMYLTHHTFAKYGFIFILIHALLLAIRWIPENTEKALRYLLPEHERIEVDLGIYALYGFVIIIFFTLVVKLPYDKWKILHKFTGVFFILAVLHVYILEVNIFRDNLLTIYFSVLIVAGVSSYFYKTFLFKFFKKEFNCVVKDVTLLSDKIMEVTLKSQKVKLNFNPGQFYFFSFRDKSLSKEYHPFTVFIGANEFEVSAMIKSLGDFTTRLHDKLKPGIKVKLEGPYGYFEFKDGNNEQVWIGGGVGIAPFISWIRDFTFTGFPENLRVNFYYCVEYKKDATYLNEFKSLELQNPNFKVHLVCAAETELLTANGIELTKQSDIFICGPKQMRLDLQKGLKNRGISSQKIHFEDFDFV